MNMIFGVLIATLAVIGTAFDVVTVGQRIGFARSGQQGSD